jgi:hypothetical protein
MRQRIVISDYDHSITDHSFIYNKLQVACNKWKKCEKNSVKLCKCFPFEKVDLLASKMCTSEEKALQVIKRAESSRHLYRNLHELLEKIRPL